jgi:hypothetical protein
MQKIWSSKSKRSQPSDDESDDEYIASNNSASIADEISSGQAQIEQAGDRPDHSLSPEMDTEPEVVITEDLDDSEVETSSLQWQDWVFWQHCPSWLKPKHNIPWGWVIMALGLGGVAITTWWGLQYLTDLDARSDTSVTCQSKISGEWQTSFGKISLQEYGDRQVSGKYTYTNFDRGQVQGKFTGELRNNIVNFIWEETPDELAKNSSQQVATEKGKGTFVFTASCLEFYGSYGTGDSTNNFGNWQGYRISKTK